MHVHICTQAHSGMQGCKQTHMPAHFKRVNSCNYACKPLQIHISLHKHRHVGKTAFLAHVSIYAQLSILEINTRDGSVYMCTQDHLYTFGNTNMQTGSCFVALWYRVQCWGCKSLGFRHTVASRSGCLMTICSCFCAQRSLSPGCSSRASWC